MPSKTQDLIPDNGCFWSFNLRNSSFIIHHSSFLLSMPKPLILLSIPALREKDVAVMPRLRNLTAGGEIADLTPGFPCVTCPVQAAMTTGRRPAEHGIVANGIYWREKRQVEMWTAPNDCIGQPQIWDLLGPSRAGTEFGRVVPAAQPRLRGRLHLHAGPHP